MIVAASRTTFADLNRRSCFHSILWKPSPRLHEHQRLFHEVQTYSSWSGCYSCARTYKTSLFGLIQLFCNRHARLNSIGSHFIGSRKCSARVSFNQFGRNRDALLRQSGIGDAIQNDLRHLFSYLLGECPKRGQSWIERAPKLSLQPVMLMSSGMLNPLSRTPL